MGKVREILYLGFTILVSEDRDEWTAWVLDDQKQRHTAHAKEVTMSSSLTLETLRTRVRSMLGDLGALDWSDDRIDAGARQALDEYSRAGLQRNAGLFARHLIKTLTPAADVRELDLSSLSPACLQVDGIWYPYEAGSPSDDPVFVRFDFYWDDDKPTVFLISAAGDGSSVARVFYRGAHTLSGLDSAVASTFLATHDNLMVLGAAGWTVEQRLTAIGEEGEKGRAGQGYTNVGRRWLTQFRAALKPRAVIEQVRIIGSDEETDGYYDPDSLEWRSLRS